MVSRKAAPPGHASATAPHCVARWLLPAAGAALFVVACGGGGGTSPTTTASASPTANASTPPAANVDDTASRRLAAAGKLYAGTPRVPEGFRLDAAPAGATGPVATVHLKSSDLPGSTANGPRWELCSSDYAEALGWSELRASWQGSYSDLVDSSTTEASYEFVRVPRSDASARLRHRVFRCVWLDRAGSDLGADAGPAGTLKTLPVTAAALGSLAEYLWQFTAFNNADHVVLSSAATTAGADQVAWRIEMVRLTRAGGTGECDRIERLAWSHAAQADSGVLSRRLELLESFRARRSDGVVQLCSD